MKSILSKLIIALLLLSSCGYKIVNDISDFKFQVIETEFNGNSKINKELQRYFSRLDSKDATRFFEIKVKEIRAIASTNFQNISKTCGSD